MSLREANVKYLDLTPIFFLQFFLPALAPAIDSQLLSASTAQHSSAGHSSLVTCHLSLVTSLGPGRAQFRGDLVIFRLWRSEEHTSELQSRFGISYAVFCLKK